MAGDPRATAALALHRFGMGPRGDALNAIQGDPRGALLAELDSSVPLQASLNFPAPALSAAQAFRNQAEFNFRRNAERRLQAQMEGQKPGAAQPNPAKPIQPARFAGETIPPQQVQEEEARFRFAAAYEAQTGFVERLVWFWSNHFCVFAPKVQAMAGGYEREVIRPHVLGRFADLLLAAESHPAMLVYLDNTQSTGPRSQDGATRAKGLNENLAREILELHTLGVDGGYAQADVTRFVQPVRAWAKRVTSAWA